MPNRANTHEAIGAIKGCSHRRGMPTLLNLISVIINFVVGYFIPKVLDIGLQFHTKLKDQSYVNFAVVGCHDS